MSRKEKKLKHQFLLIVLLSSIPFFLIENILTLNIMLLARGQLQTQMKGTTTRLHNTFEALLKTNVNTYLLSKVETGSDIVNRIIYGPEYTGDSFAKKKETAISALSSLQVGKTGYFYALDSSGVVIFHPDDNIVGEDLHDQSPVKVQIIIKKGYLEYEFQNTYETQLKKKALYMTYIPEFDWILTATSYRDEFTDMLNKKSIQDTVTSISFGESGYSYVVDREGELIAHPKAEELTGTGLLVENNPKELADRLFEQESGYTTYQWKNNPDSSFRKKIVYVKYIEDFDWIVGTAMNINEVDRQITIMFVINLIIALIIAFLLFIIVRRVSRKIENPISGIYETLELAIAGDLGARTLPAGPIEIRTLGENLNNFISTLEARTKSLEATIDEKDFLLREIQHRIKNNLQTIMSLLNLQSDFTDNAEAKTSLLSTRNRVSVMSLVYDHMLLSDSDFKKDKLALPGFLNNYINTIMSSPELDYSKLKLSCDISDIYIKRDTAISLGLILNELLSHCIKNSKNTDTAESMSLSLKPLNDHFLILEIIDNSCSFCPEKWNREYNKIAYILVEILTQQISGVTSLSHQDKTYSYKIKFQIKP